MVELSFSIKTFMFTISIITFLMVLNTFLRYYIEKKTQFNGVDVSYYDWKFITVYLFIGFTFLFFKTRVKEYRKYIWIKDMIRRMEWQGKAYPNSLLYDEKKYINYKRYLQLKKLKKLSK